MAILVDRPRWTWRGRIFGHLVSDESLEELHRFAGTIGLPRAAFGGDHYDLPDRLHERALAHGATLVRSRDLVLALRAAGLRIPRNGNGGVRG